MGVACRILRFVKNVLAKWQKENPRIRLKRPEGIPAANQIRTDDLILTKDVLYHLSHSSRSLTTAIYYSR